MASGDTIPGQVKLFRIENDGAEVPLTGSIPVNRLDSFNNDRNPEERFYINASLSNFRTIPGGASERIIRDAQYLVNESIVVRFKAGTNPANDVDVDADSFQIDVVRKDNVRGSKRTDTLGGVDNSLSTNVDTPTDEFVTIYKFTIPDETEFRIAGEFAPVPVEA